MRLATCVIGVALLGLVGRPSVALADDAAPSSYRAVIDRVDLEPASVGGLRLRVKLSALSIQGQLIDLNGPRTVKLLIGGSKVEAPYALGLYGSTYADTAIVVVVQANADYAEALPRLIPALDTTVLETLNDRTQLAILPYSEATGTGKLASLKSVRGRLDQITPASDAGAPALLDTLDRAMLLLKRARTSPDRRPLRKLIVVIGDGRDRANDRERVTALGERANKEGIRIHTFGYAPTKVLRPLLALGELSKRSLGTFRYVRSGGAESWTPAFQQLRDEINKQYVLTYFLPASAEVASKKLKVVTVGATEITSNEMKIPEPACGGEPCAGYCADGVCRVPLEPQRRGIVGWVLLLVGIAVAVIAALGVIGFVIQRRQGGIAHPPVPGQPLAPGQLPVPLQAGHPGLPPGAKPPRLKKSRLPRNPPAPVAAPVAAPPPGPALLIVSGPRAGERHPLQNGFTIGKAPGSTLVLDDGYTSSQHAQVGMDQFGNCRLYDRNSTNGTFVNGVRVNEVVLDHGMSVRIGSTELRFLAQ
ncbi:MAG TPA: FHA domain-containing protein [Kofleriaceae bacterium]|nr:FHA domain-containing protein [Kofleriaceae bacterium]